MPTILIADGDADVRRNLSRQLEDRGFAVVGAAADTSEAVALAAAHEPDLCVVDLRLPGGGLAAIARIAKVALRTSIVVLAEHDEAADVLAVLERGAAGYLLRRAGPDELATALRAAANGEPALSRALVPLLVDHVRRGSRRRVVLPSGAVQLTGREWDVGELLRDGHSTDEIAARLGLSPVTVRRHIGLLVKKLGAADRDAAVATLRLFAR